MSTTHDPTDVLLPDPAAAEPSPVPGLSRAAFDAMARNIRFFSSLTLAQQLRAIAQDIEWLRRSEGLVDAGSTRSRP